MTIRNFILQIERIKSEFQNQNIEIGSDWDIKIIDDDFNAYISPLFHIVFCLDSLRIFCIFQPYFRDINQDDDYYFWGEDPTTNWTYSMDQESNEILLIDLNDMSIMEFCAEDDYHFLDALELAAQYYSQKILTNGAIEENQMEWLTKCYNAAGGEKYKLFCMRLLG